MQILHVASVSFNSVLLGQILKPDWDIFHLRPLLHSYLFFSKLWPVFLRTDKILTYFFCFFFFLLCQSDHASAEFHAAARVVGGCGDYVSDKPGSHNFSFES